MYTEIKTLYLYIFKMNIIYFIVATNIVGLLVKQLFNVLVPILEEVTKFFII